MRVPKVFLVVALVLLLPLVGMTKSESQVGEGFLVVTLVYAVESAPISHAFVFVHYAGGKPNVVKREISLNTGPAGETRISRAEGLYDVFVAASACAPACKVVKIDAGKTTTFTAKLQADEEHLEQ